MFCSHSHIENVYRWRNFGDRSITFNQLNVSSSGLSLFEIAPLHPNAAIFGLPCQVGTVERFISDNEACPLLMQAMDFTPIGNLFFLSDGLVMYQNSPKPHPRA